MEEYLHSIFGYAESTGPAKCRPTTSVSLSDINKLNELSERNDDSDQDSIAEGTGEEKPYDSSLNHLDQMECFTLESVACQNLHR